ncbi:hypothetical protein RHGRI_023257 [Rhododendron griersonianum]|uniref:Uncharacterized protein n=1 Tax=Rhododendron griersonianum TaxID=479676 RepID=A0AAV6J4Y0_9ERIC|nr:hypothetical protein RHGRI_023257 [Rhododendron griersonianum]
MIKNSSNNGAEDVNGENKEIHCSNNFQSRDNVLVIEKDNVVENRDVQRGKVDGLVSLRNSSLSECQSTTSPTPLLRPVMKDRSDVKDRSNELSILGERFIHQAIEKLERRLNRLRRKIRKKKSLSEFGLKEAKMLQKYKKVPNSSLSSHDICNRNSLLIN